MCTLWLKTFQKIPNFPFFSSHKVQKQKLKTNIFNFCVHYSFNVWTHEYNVAIQVFFFFAAIGEAVTGRRWNIPSSHLERGESRLYLKHLCPYFPTCFNSDFYIPSDEPVSVWYCWRKSTIKFLFCQPHREDSAPFFTGEQKKIHSRSC